MTKIICVTSMNKPYYDHIGKLMIESWSKFWPDDCELIVYQEGFEIEDFDRVNGVSWEDHCYQDWLNFIHRAENPESKRFAKKGYTMISAMKNIECDLLIWCDADTLTYQKFPKEKILSILPDNKLIAFFDTYYQHNKPYIEEEYINPNRTNSAIESGFVVINKKHKYFNNYLNEYKKLYNTPTPLPEVGPWFDGNVCGAAAANFRHHVEDLSKLRTTDKSQTPINKSWISKYCYHAKAEQKNKLDFESIRKKLGINT